MMNAKTIYSLLKINAAYPVKYNIDKRGSLAGWEFHFSARSKDNLWGRFGGGWDWKLGVQGGGNTFIISLLIADLRISKSNKQP